MGARSAGKTPIRVNLASSFAGQRAILERGNDSSGSMRYTLIFTQVLNSKGDALFSTTTSEKSGETLRVRIGSVTVASVAVP